MYWVYISWRICVSCFQLRWRWQIHTDNIDCLRWTDWTTAWCWRILSPMGSFHFPPRPPPSPCLRMCMPCCAPSQIGTLSHWGDYVGKVGDSTAPPQLVSLHHLNAGAFPLMMAMTMLLITVLVTVVGTIWNNIQTCEEKHSHVWSFLRLAVNGDLAAAWPFAVEGEAFAHRFFSKSSSHFLSLCSGSELGLHLYLKAFSNTLGIKCRLFLFFQIQRKDLFINYIFWRMLQCNAWPQNMISKWKNLLGKMFSPSIYVSLWREAKL